MTETRPRRTESESVRRAQLLKAARKVFRAKGYERASVSEIAREAGLAKGTFYFYFPAKIDAATSLRDGLMETMAQAVTTSVALGTSFEYRLRSLIAASFKVARKNADLFKLAYVGVDETHPEMHSASPEHASFLNAITKLFVEAVDAGEMTEMDPEIAARLATGLLQHAMMEAFVFGKGEESDRLELGVSVMLLNALRRIV